MLTDAPRDTALRAVRDSEVVRMPKTLFNALALRHPEVTLQLSRMIAMRARSLQQHRAAPEIAGLPSLDPAAAPTRPFQNLRTVALYPTHPALSMTDFTAKLASELRAHGPVLVLRMGTVLKALGKHAFSQIGKLKLGSWLEEQETKHRVVLFEVDPGSQVWTEIAVRQADCLLLVAMGDHDPSVTDMEGRLLRLGSTTRKELVLLHNERHCIPGTTHRWLLRRPWVHGHHHLHLPYRAPPTLGPVERRTTLGSQLRRGLLRRVYPGLARRDLEVQSFACGNDVARLARFLMGKMVGLVLGGGGARGIAHIGVIRALEEAGRLRPSSSLLTLDQASRSTWWAGRRLVR